MSRLPVRSNIVKANDPRPSKDQNEVKAPRNYEPPKLWTTLKYPNPRYRTLKNEISSRKNSVEADLEPQKPSFEGEEVNNKENEEELSTARTKYHASHPTASTLSYPDHAAPYTQKPDVCNADGIGEHEEICRHEKPPESMEASCSIEDGDPISELIRKINEEVAKSVQNLNKSKSRLIEIQASRSMCESNVKDLEVQNEKLLIEAERFERIAKNVQSFDLVDRHKRRPVHNRCRNCQQNSSVDILCEKCQQNNIESYCGTGMNRASTVSTECSANTSTEKSNSENDMTRRLNESYDMQEQLVAANAELEAKRYTLVKELMTKDQNLETCRAHVKILQAELKLINKENHFLREKLIRNSPEGDVALSESKCNQELKQQERVPVDENEKELLAELQTYKIKNQELQKEITSLENKVRHLKLEMDKSACRDATYSSNKSCAMHGDLHCPAPCNTNSGQTPGDKEIQKLQIQLRQTEENFKTKVTECAILRTEFQKQKEELEKERCLHREVAHKLRELEMKFEGLTAQTNSLLGTKEQAFEQEVNVKALKQCYREARDEIEELRLLMKEQNDQLQDYRVKYLQAQQLVEEQKRQMDTMDMDNARISEQINLEIQRVKLVFQEKLQELAPIPDLLRSTQIKLKDAQQNQAIAEHNAEQLARELNSAREKIHMLLNSKIKPIEKPTQDKSSEEKQIALLSQRVTQLTEMNTSYKNEIERLKGNVIRMEEAVLANEKRLQEKLHECAQLGGELDRTRDEAARALQRASERTETIRKCMQTSIAELERQLAAARAQVKIAEKDKEQVQARMQSQIQRLNENFEQAQLRILGLQTQVQTLKRTVSSTDEGEGDNEECTCKNFFD
ncbi:centromere protein F [Aricia agestis]|uniref:centromere protein F n=1 Tax=Aricia agestis TaxID=91739 RepID=UPI001C2060B2|nr:centromere protein F [Aricia agestis]